MTSNAQSPYIELLREHDHPKSTNKTKIRMYIQMYNIDEKKLIINGFATNIS